VPWSHCPNKNVFSDRLNWPYVSPGCLRYGDKLFHTLFSAVVRRRDGHVGYVESGKQLLRTQPHDDLYDILPGLRRRRLAFSEASTSARHVDSWSTAAGVPTTGELDLTDVCVLMQ